MYSSRSPDVNLVPGSIRIKWEAVERMPGHRFFGGYIVSRRDSGGGAGKITLGAGMDANGIGPKERFCNEA
jgi:hypothetical protein